MKIGILGTGIVGRTVGAKLISLGHEVKLGSRTTDNEKATEWTKANGNKASNGTFEDAAKFGETILLATNGNATLDIIKMARPENFKGKTVLDISNPLDTSKGMPPTLFVKDTDSLCEQVQKAIPEAHVVKSLNIVNCEVMVDPVGKSGGDPTMFLAGNDAGAKEQVKKLLTDFGWKDIIDLGDITGARGMEMILPLWVRVWMSTGSGYGAFKLVRK